MGRDKIRIRFRKDGALRLISHHDLMRCFERMLRRAGLPFHSTAGFNPKPRLVFALSLGLGIVGCAEVVELELDEEIPLEEIHARLIDQAPSGLEIQSIRRIDWKSGAQVRRVVYRIMVPSDRHEETNRRMVDLLAAPSCIVDRLKPQPRKVEIRPYVKQLRLVGDDLELDLIVTPNGTARPDELLVQLGLRDLLPAGAVLERTTVELHDECDDPVTGVNSSLISSSMSQAASASRQPTPEAALQHTTSLEGDS
jgi:radical SAM-linked protein